VKVYIFYEDIEVLGLEREAIWYNRERSGQLFWQMLDEVNHEEDFSDERPLCIQLQALENVLELLLTKPHLSTRATPHESIEDRDETIDITINEKAKQMLDDKKEPSEGSENAGLTEDDSSLWMTAHFNNLEDVIQLSHYINSSYESELITVLYYYDGKYYLYIELSPELFEYQEDILSQILEYSTESDITYHILDEYGNVIFQKDVFRQVRKYFSAMV